jgi:hypothetical protein
MIIIGLHGKKQSGKNTFARLAMAMCKVSCFELAFADSLKQEVAAACDITMEEIERKKSLYRPMLQWWGTEFRRSVTDDYWVRRIADKIVKLPSDTSVCFITDVRFINEAKFIKDIGGVLIKIKRDLEDVNDLHASEISMDGYTDFDYIVNNDGTISDLLVKVRTTLVSIRNNRKK